MIFMNDIIGRRIMEPSVASFEIPIVEDFRKIPEGVDLDLILDCEFGSVKWAVYTTAVEYKIFDHLDAPLTAEELSGCAGFHPLVTSYLLDALAGLGFLTKKDNRYENALTAEKLLARWGYVFESIKWNPFWSRLGRMLAEGKIEPLGSEAEFKPSWGSFEMQRHFALRALAGEFQMTLELMEANGAFNRVKNFIDIGGGHGIFSIGFLKTHPDLNGTIFELPQVTPVTRRFLEAYKMEEKIKIIAGDIYKDPIPGRYDLAFISNIGIPYVSYDGVKTASKKIYEAIEDGGSFVIKEIIPHKDWSESFYQLAHSLPMLIHWGDPEEFASALSHITAEQLMGIMRDVGFADVKFLGWVRRWCTVIMGLKR